MKKNKGFTLIELLVVVAVIGILATAVIISLGSAREKARDSRRVSDLKEVQNALELYYSRYLYYPNASTFAEMMNAFASDPTLGINKIPEDPMNAGTHVYAYCAFQDIGSGQPQRYALGAVLEDAGSNLIKSSVAPDSSCSAGPFSDCGPANAAGNYCIVL